MSQDHGQHRQATKGTNRAPIIDPEPSCCCAVILAAGASKRMGSPKALKAWPSRSLAAQRLGWSDRSTIHRDTIKAPSFLEGILRTCRQAQIPAVVVTRPDQTDVRRALDDLDALGLPLHRATNPMEQSEMVDSFWFGAQEALRQFPQSVSLLVWPVDCPAVTTEDLCLLTDKVRSMPNAYLALSWQGQPGHPASIPRSVVEAMTTVGIGRADRPQPPPDLRSLTGAVCGPAVLLESTGPGILLNLNRPQDLRHLTETDMKP